MIIATSFEQYVFIFPHGKKWWIPCSFVLTIIMWLKKSLLARRAITRFILFWSLWLLFSTIKLLHTFMEEGFKPSMKGTFYRIYGFRLLFFLLLKFCWRPFVWLIGKMMNKCRLKSELVIFQPHINMRL